MITGYTVYTAVKVYETENKTSKIVWSYCSCAAGVTGSCKHSYAFLYKIQSLERLGTEFLGMDFDTPTPTGRFKFYVFSL